MKRGRKNIKKVGDTKEVTNLPLMLSSSPVRLSH